MLSDEKPAPVEQKAFWERQAVAIGAFGDALTTEYYLQGEKRLIRSCLPAPTGLLALKLDLWNEVKNTNILGWLEKEGAVTHAIDISQPLVEQAAAQFRKCGLVPRFAVASLYELPYATGTFDFLYTMGTIEHVADMGLCVREIFRVLKPGAIAVVGLPNKLDPFLRPLLVYFMNLAGVYPYGFEQSLSARQLRALLAKGGFEVLADDGVLFMPGIIRMAELYLLQKNVLLSRLVGALHWPFRALVKLMPALNRHGYLIACVVRKPQT